MSESEIHAIINHAHSISYDSDSNEAIPDLPRGSNPIEKLSIHEINKPNDSLNKKPEIKYCNDKLCNCSPRDLFAFGCRCGGR